MDEIIAHKHKLFDFQVGLVNFNKYENEFETVLLLYELPKEDREKSRKLSLDWLESLLQHETATLPSRSNMEKESNRLRQEGNTIFTTKGENRDLLAAVRLYTRAILEAPAVSSTLALAHANRAMALQEYGYFQQAYDDCDFAIAQGYPQHLIHKVITRQAYCAWRLKDVARLRRHLDTLDQMTLNASFSQQVLELQDKLQELLQGTSPYKNQDHEQELPLHRHTQEMVTSGAKGRYMITTQAIAEGELIFSECASSFVPVSHWRICQQCAATQLIPFPCMHCRGRVIYCSRKCLLQHASTHAHECAAYQHGLFAHIGISHLAFRMVLDGLPQVLPHLCQMRNARALWTALVDSEGLLHQQGTVEYTQTLQMATHLGRSSHSDIARFAVVAQLLVLYLQESTSFFDLIVASDTDADRHDWQLITGALILRHIGQLIVNGHTCCSIVPLRCESDIPLHDLPLLANGLWCSPNRVRRGCLHKFSDYEEVTAANFPYLSIFNHACETSLQPRFNGRYVSAYAARSLCKGEQIFNCYSLDYRCSRRDVRRADLQGTYHFKCECTKCERMQPDKDYESFHHYRCERTQCGQVFVPQLHTLRWWHSDECLKCTICGVSQRCEWFHKFKELLKCVRIASSRCLLYKSFTALDNWLLNYHELKLCLANQVVKDCFAAHNDGFFLKDAEFVKLTHILQFFLRGTARQNRVNSIEYISQMTYLWDFIALKKYNCSRDEMHSMLKAIEIASEEMKTIFMHYYEDYIKDMIS